MLRKRPGPRRVRASWRILPVSLCVVVASIAPALSGAPASADPQATIASKAAEARRIERQIEANGQRVSVLDEQYNQTLLKIEEANRGLADAQARIDSARRDNDRLNGLLQGRAAQLYTQAGSQSPFPELDVKTVQELGARTKYSDAAAQHDDNLIADLSAARELLGQRQHELKKIRADAQAQEHALGQQRSEVEAASARQTQLLSQVKGELKRLVNEEARRRAAAAQAAARAAFQARIAREQAARAAASSVSSNSGGSSSGGSSNSPSVAAPNVPAPGGGAQTAIDTAKAQLGKRYVYAAAGPDTFDCSGLTMFAWAAAGVSLPHSSAAQYASLPHVPMDAMAPGDLVFYGSPIHHVGMYLGGGVYIHAPHTGDVVKISTVYRDDFAGAARPG